MVRRNGLQSVVAIAAVAAIALAIAAAGGARGVVVGCGTVVTADLTLKKNLTGCPSDGLIVVSSGVTVDLNGHSIRGLGSGSGVRVAAAAGGDCPVVSVTIKNGAIEGFTNGVRMADACQPGDLTFNTLTDLAIDHNGTGVLAGQSDGAGSLTIENSSITENSGDGIGFHPAFRATVRNNLIALNGGAGVSAQPESDGGSYYGNTIVGNGGPGMVFSSSVSSATNNVVTDNDGGGIIALETEAQSLGPLYAFAGNNASRNGGLGVSACVAFSSDHACEAGMTDDGGNVAVGNSDSRQCVNISCGTPHDCATATLQAGLKTLSQATTDSDRAGSAEAFRTTAIGTGAVSSICIFVASSNAARQLIAGLYSDENGHPGRLLAQGLIPMVTNGAFNTVWIPSVPLTAGTRYWIAVLAPEGAGTLRIRDHCCGYQSFSPSEGSREGDLVALGPVWTTGTRRPNDGPLLGWTGG